MKTHAGRIVSFKAPYYSKLAKPRNEDHIVSTVLAAMSARYVSLL